MCESVTPAESADPFRRSRPCQNCPYRTDAPLQLWAVEEFENLVANEGAELGTFYNCHKNDGCVCVGWLMKQDQAGLPSIRLRVTLSRHKVPVEYLDGLNSPADLYPDVLSMCRANYPEFEWGGAQAESRESQWEKLWVKYAKVSKTKGDDRNQVNLGHSVLKASENLIKDDDTKLENTGSR